MGVTASGRGRGAASRMFLFISCNNVWGGSEELWSLAAQALARDGHAITVLKYRINATGGRLGELRALGCRVVELTAPTWLPRQVRTIGSALWPIARRMSDHVLNRELRKARPKLVVISQGINHEGWMAATACRKHGIPYVLISQKADDLYWPGDSMMEEWREAYAHAAAALFVSRHNLTLTQEQLGEKLERGRVVANPFRADWETPLPWPASSDTMRLACVGRLDAREKGQDLVLRVLAKPKWRGRPVEVSFIGSGHNREGLEGMARYLKVDNVTFAGFTDTPEQIYADHHALLLASRCEGLPLSLVEAMLSGRPAIITDAGGSAEMVVEGKTGFLAATPTVEALDEAMERAWAARDRWPQIGLAAAAHARAHVPQDPARTLAHLLAELAAGGAAA